MKEYFVGIMVSVVFGALAISILSEGGEKKYLRMLCGVATAGCIILPLADFFREGSDALKEVEDMFAVNENEEEHYDEIYNKTLTSAGVKNAEQSLKNLIISRLNVDGNDFDVNIFGDVESDVFCIKRVEFLIFPSGIAIDPHKVEKLVTDLLKCDFDVIYCDEKNN